MAAFDSGQLASLRSLTEVFGPMCLILGNRRKRFAGQMALDQVTGGSPYGATTIAGGDGSRKPSENELAGARYQGKKIAQTAQKLFG